MEDVLLPSFLFVSSFLSFLNPFLPSCSFRPSFLFLPSFLSFLSFLNPFLPSYSFLHTWKEGCAHTYGRKAYDGRKEGLEEGKEGREE
jgi:hypothetical protein